MNIANQGLEGEEFCCAHGTDFRPTDWVFSRTVDSSQGPVPIHVELWDQDDAVNNILDIANGPSSLDITVNLSTCTWQGGGLRGVLNTQSSSQGSGNDSARIYFVIFANSSACFDSDGDGLLDGWESNGYDAEGDGVVDIDLRAMGADPHIPDVFVEIDYFNDVGAAAAHSHAPFEAAVRRVVQAFANAPVSNPVGGHGIQLHGALGLLGSARTDTVQYLVPCSTADVSQLTNSAQARGEDLLGNELVTSDWVTTLVHTPVLTLSKSGTSSVTAGEAISYTITYENTGSADAVNVTITDTLPAGIYYSVGLDEGSGPRPSAVTVNTDGTRRLVWNVGTVRANSGPLTLAFTARPTLLALGGTSYTNSASLSFENGAGCTFAAVRATATTNMSTVPASRNPLGLRFWRNHPELYTVELLARIQATDQRYDGRNATMPDGVLSLSEVAASLVPGGNMAYVLEEQLLATYFNLAARHVNAGSAISSKLAATLGLQLVRDAVIYAADTLQLPVTAVNRPRYSAVTRVLEEVNENKSLQ